MNEEQYFVNCRNMEEARALFHQLLKTHHPDIAGEAGEEITKAVILQFRDFTAELLLNRHSAWCGENKKEPVYTDMTPFAGILLKVIHLDIQIEIVGWWIYCRGNTYPVKEYLKDLGFWFSGKHKAWVYSGKKKNFRPRSGHGAYDLYEAVEVNRGSEPRERAGDRRRLIPS